MTKSKSIIYWQAKNTEQKIIQALQNNKVVITTTDTIPGFLANVTKQGFEALNKIKEGRQGKPYIILISEQSKLNCFIDPKQLTPEIQKIIKCCWPGPLTIIFKAKDSLPGYLKSADGTVAIRCPKHDGLLKILKHFDGLYSTSANKSIHEAPMTIDEVDAQVAMQVELLVDDADEPEVGRPTASQPVTGKSAAGKSTAGKPSTIIDVSQISQASPVVQASPVGQAGLAHEKHFRVVRQGAYSIQDLEKILGKA